MVISSIEYKGKGYRFAGGMVDDRSFHRNSVEVAMEIFR